MAENKKNMNAPSVRKPEEVQVGVAGMGGSDIMRELHYSDVEGGETANLGGGRGMIDRIKEKSGKFIDGVKDTGGKVLVGVKETGGKMIDGVKETGGKVFVGVKETGGKAIDHIGGIADKGVKMVKDIGKKKEEEEERKKKDAEWRTNKHTPETSNMDENLEVLEESLVGEMEVID